MKKYYPDFYLVGSGIYLDPKNDYLAKKDKNKIDSVVRCNNVKVYILTLEKITENYINSLLCSTMVVQTTDNR